MEETFAAVALQVERDLDGWAEQMRAIGDSVPDFWSELNASERIAEWLAACGYRRSATPLIARPGDVLAVPKSHTQKRRN